MQLDAAGSFIIDKPEKEPSPSLGYYNLADTQKLISEKLYSGFLKERFAKDRIKWQQIACIDPGHFRNESGFRIVHRISFTFQIPFS